jgi:tetratricopeptide (TPR) repeat protein
MSAVPGKRTEDLPPTQVRRLDQVCDRFETAWKAGERPRIEDYLAGTPEAEWPELLRELIRVEVYYRCSAGEVPQREEYQARFPMLDAAWLAETLAALAPVRPSIPGFEILGELGRGGMGVVYKARQPQLDRVVALKMILAGGHADAEHLARFGREAAAVAQLQHPNIVQLYAVGECEGRPYFSLEFVDGGSLAGQLNGAPQAPRTAAGLVETLARAVDYAHQRGVVHRDLKPANILLQPSLPQRRQDAKEDAKEQEGSLGGSLGALAPLRETLPKITDFGLAKRLVQGQADQTQTGQVMGTPSYMAPEQAEGKKTVGPAADVYALGAILYEMLTGRPPFRAETPLDTVLQVRRDEPVPPRRLQPKVPRDLETICLKCLRKEPAKRYATALALAEDLRRFQAGEPIQARPVGAAGRLWRWSRRQPLAAGALAYFLLTVVVGFTAVTWQWRQTVAEKLRVESERDQAERDFRRALQAVNDAYARLGQDRQHDPAPPPVQQGMLEGALNYYRDLLQQRGQDPSLRVEVARTYFRVGHINNRIGSKTEALTAYQQAQTLLQELVRDHPAEPFYRSQLAKTQTNLANLHVEFAQDAEGQRCLQEARTLLEGLVRDHPRVLEYQVDLGIAYIASGYEEHRAGRLEAARRFLQQSRDLWEQLVRDHPQEPDYRHSLSTTWQNIAQVLCSAGAEAEAYRAYERARELDKALTEAWPQVPAYQCTLARTYNNLGFLNHRRQHFAEAQQCFESALPLWEQLVRAHPSTGEFRQGLASCYNQLASVHMRLGRVPEAHRLHEQGLKHCEHLCRSHPGFVRYQSDLGGSLNNVSWSLVEMGRLDEAAEHLQRAIEIQVVAVAKAPQVLQYREYLNQHYLNMAILRRRQGRPEEAADVTRKRLQLWPDNPTRLCDSAASLALCIPVVGGGKTELSAAEQAQRRQYADETMAALRQAIAKGFKSVERLRKDAEFDPLRERADFQKLVADLAARAGNPPPPPARPPDKPGG